MWYATCGPLEYRCSTRVSASRVVVLFQRAVLNYSAADVLKNISIVKEPNTLPSIFCDFSERGSGAVLQSPGVWLR